ncbi:MAG TPA: PPOX class F420-dependent oxidoreductase [Acidimicrobiales bacterium]|nr:PPOX class F420-dependent oxidoreductase [Acidimicrobiales bacterium]
MNIDDARRFIANNHRAVLATTRADGGAQLSPVTAGVDAEGRVVISTRETAMKARNLRRTPRAALCVFTDRFFGEWVQVEGNVELVSLPEAMDGLVDYYRAISGEHPDWDEYREVMVRDGRVLVRLTIDRAGPNQSG